MDTKTGAALLDSLSNSVAYSPVEMVINLSLALALGLIIAYSYRATHKGLSYSQSFTLTIVFVSLIVAMIMMVIGASLARAFALVGALSIIRFRTVVKDTKDTAYVFAALAVGMGAGTSNYFLAVVGMLFVIGTAWVLYRTNFGALYKSEFILRFGFDQESSSQEYLEKIQTMAKRSNLLHIEPSGDGRYTRLTYDIVLTENVTADELSRSIDEAEGTTDVILIASKNDVDY